MELQIELRETIEEKERAVAQYEKEVCLLLTSQLTLVSSDGGATEGCGATES